MDWEADETDCLLRLYDSPLDPTVIVRSCAYLEDDTSSQAPGYFNSVLGVQLRESESLKSAINTVISSYRNGGRSKCELDRVLVQSQLLDVSLGGVGFVDPSIRYVILDIDTESGRTDGVTSGRMSERVVIAPCRQQGDELWDRLYDVFIEIACQFDGPVIIEFAVCSQGRVNVFQVRPDRRKLPAVKPISIDLNTRLLRHIKSRLNRDGPISVMTDWNPAELLGSDPGRLDTSLYQTLVTDEAWAVGRSKLGWRMPQNTKLIETYCGMPYVRVNTSLESLLPAGVPEWVGQWLIEDRSNLIAGSPELHDKVEFRVMWSAYAFDEQVVARDLKKRGLVSDGVDSLFCELKKVTASSLGLERLSDPYGDQRGTLERCSADLKNFDVRNSDPSALAEIVERSLSIIREHGVIPFSEQARLAFTYRYVLNRMITLDPHLEEAFLNWARKLQTITSSYRRDLASLKAGELDRHSFLTSYGSLRPNAYNIESARYDESLEYFENTDVKRVVERNSQPEIPRSQSVTDVLKGIGDFDEAEFWHRCGEAFRNRESLKFHFSKVLSDLLKLIAAVSESSGSTRSTLRKLRIGEITSILRRSDSLTEFAKKCERRSDRRLMERKYLTHLPMPDFASKGRDFEIIVQISNEPTFVGNRSIQAQCVPLRETHVPDGNATQLSGSIIFLTSADPGFDWIFGHDIRGLITEYGGEFSHMALRCAEFGIPAAIGCGVKTGARLVANELTLLDPVSKELWVRQTRIYPSNSQ